LFALWRCGFDGSYAPLLIDCIKKVKTLSPLFGMQVRFLCDDPLSGEAFGEANPVFSIGYQSSINVVIVNDKNGLESLY
jgi:hypothetical protein